MKVARAFGLNYQVVALRLGMSAGHNAQELALGRSEMREYIVAYRSNGQEWTKAMQQVLNDARRKFNARTNEMCQGRDGEIIIQHLIPHLVTRKPRRLLGAEV